mmetsp:Transcript_47581/g.53228  ORF Transcript_47581/g.53228 Transcript_47581/m.53228 type:complete len:1033 (+) Transcript_47581:50-3148(+)
MNTTSIHSGNFPKNISCIDTMTISPDTLRSTQSTTIMKKDKKETNKTSIIGAAVRIAEQRQVPDLPPPRPSTVKVGVDGHERSTPHPHPPAPAPAPAHNRGSTICEINNHRSAPSNVTIHTGGTPQNRVSRLSTSITSWASMSRSSKESSTATINSSSRCSGTRTSRIKNAPISASPIIDYINTNTNTNMNTNTNTNQLLMSQMSQKKNKNKNRDHSRAESISSTENTMMGMGIEATPPGALQRATSSMSREEYLYDSSNSIPELEDEDTNNNNDTDNDNETEETVESQQQSQSASYSTGTASHKLHQGFQRVVQQQHKLSHSAQQRLQQTKAQLRKKLDVSGSVFFQENPSHKVPRFAPRELSFGELLGEGEFGTVYKIDSLGRQPPPSSDDETLVMEGILNDISSSFSVSNITSSTDTPTQSLVSSSGETPTATATPRTEAAEVGTTATDTAHTGTTTTRGNSHLRSDSDPIHADFTLPLATDLFVSDSTLDGYIRRKIDTIKEYEEQKPLDIQRASLLHAGSNTLLDDCDSLNSSHHRTGHPNRRHALRLNDPKGEMIQQANSARDTATAADQENDHEKGDNNDNTNNDATTTTNFEGYAVKLVRQDMLSDTKKRRAAVDMASEAKMLSALSHPNIIRIRGVLGYLERPGQYGIIMDKLRGTLQGQIQVWSKLNQEEQLPKAAPSSTPTLLERVPQWMCTSHEKRKLVTLQRQSAFWAERMEAVLDVAHAMRYIHQKRILFRDLKPENVGLMQHNKYVLFDFGLARELKESDRLDPAYNNHDRYRKTTGLTGSRLFMAPEVARCKPYGFSADVFSFSILFWEVFALQEVFPDLTMNKHFQYVIKRGRRPASLAHLLPEELNTMLTSSWSSSPPDRPTFESICDILSTEIESRTETFQSTSASNFTASLQLPWMSSTKSIKVDNNNDHDHNNGDDVHEFDHHHHYYNDGSKSFDSENDETDSDEHSNSICTQDRGYHSDYCKKRRRQHRLQRKHEILKPIVAFVSESLKIPASLKNISSNITGSTIESKH